MKTKSADNRTNKRNAFESLCSHLYLMQQWKDDKNAILEKYSANHKGSDEELMKTIKNVTKGNRNKLKDLKVTLLTPSFSSHNFHKMNFLQGYHTCGSVFY